MSEKVLTYLQTIEDSLDDQLAEESALKIIDNPKKELKDFLLIIDHSSGIELHGNLEDYVLSVLDKVNEKVNNENSNLDLADLELIYQYINSIVINRSPTFDKVTFTFEKAERNTQIGKEMLYLSKVLASLDKIRLNVAQNNFDNMSSFERCREKSFANTIKDAIGFDNTDKFVSLQDDSISKLDDSKLVNKQELTEKNIVQPHLNKTIEMLSKALVNIKNEDFYLTDESRKNLETAVNFMCQHYMAENSASVAVCDMIDNQRTMG